MRALFVTLLLACALVDVAPVAVAAAEAPILSVGDFFEVRDLIVPDKAPTSSRTVRTTVDALEPIQFNGKGVDAVRTVTRFVGTDPPSPPSNGSITTWARATDGATLKSVSSFGDETRETLYETPCLHEQFPLAVGDQWVVICRSTTKVTGASGAASSYNETTNTAYQVLRTGTLTVGAGTFDVFEIQHTNQGRPIAPIHSWYAPGACSEVRTLEDSGGYNDTYDLMAFHCTSVQGAATKPAPASAAALALGALAAAATMLAARRPRP